MKEQRRKAPYLQMHRMARIYFYINRCKVDKGKSKTQLITKSAMINGFINNAYCDKLTMEAATLSYIPQFCSKYNKKILAANFGQDTKNLVMEVDELVKDFHRMQFEEDYEGKAHTFSNYAKEVYLFQAYADMVDIFTVNRKAAVFEGVTCPIKRNQKCWLGEDNTPYLLDFFEEVQETKRKGKKERIGKIGDLEISIKKGKCDIIKDTAGDWVPKPDFDKYLIDVLEWKIQILKYSGIAIKDALHSSISQYKKRQGFEFQLNENTFYTNANQEEPYYDKETVNGASS